MKNQLTMKDIKKMIKILSLVMLTLTGFAQNKDYSKKLGLKFNDPNYASKPKKASNVVFRGTLPGSINLSQYCPPIKDQGEYGTCVGWSTAYYMRTMMEARVRRLSSNDDIAATTFSPLYIYNQIKYPNDFDCQAGAQIPDALDVMLSKGAALFNCVTSCGQDVSGCHGEASQFKIENYSTLFNYDELNTTTKIVRIKEALAQSEVPVPIGMLLPRSFFSATDSWKAAPSETPEDAVGGHAIAIIGYDDSKYGGSFLIANSWGTQWGNKGFTWAKYEDVARFTKYAFQILLKENPTPPPTVVSLKSSMNFTLTNGNEKMQVTTISERGLDVTNDEKAVDMITYRMINSYTTGTRFKMSINNNKQSYVYIIGSDEVNRVTKLFPSQGDVAQNVSAIVPQNSSVLLPAADKSFTMDTQTGNDYFLVLISEKELNLEDITTKIKNGTGSFKQKVFNLLGNDFITPVNIQYQPNDVAFEVKGNPKGTIVPMLVQIVHK